MDPDQNEELFPDPDEERRRVKRSYGIACSAVAFQVLVSEAAAAALSRISEAPLLKRPLGGPLANILALCVTALTFALAVWFGMGRLRAFRLRDVLDTRFRSKAVIPGILGVMAIAPVSLLIASILILVTGNTGGAEYLAEALSYGDNAFFHFLILVYTCVLGPILEELLFRGFVMNALAPVSKRFAVIVSALLFSLVHANFMQMPNTFLVGLFLGYMAFKSGSVIPGIISHMTLNSMAAVLETIISRSDGAEGVLFLLAEFAVGLACMIRYIRKNGRLRNDTDHIVPDCASFLPVKSENTVKLLFTRPSFWFTVLYGLGSAVFFWIISVPS